MATTTKSTFVTKLQPYTKQLPIVVSVVIGIFNVLLGSKILHVDAQTAYIVNGILATLGFSSLHVNSL